MRRVLTKTEDPTKQKVLFMALLTSSLPKGGARPVLEGGSAIEVYLDGMLRTGDMDIVYPIEGLKRILKAWRFELGGRLRAWVNDELGLAVDMVGGDLSGSKDRVTTITTEYGPGTILGVEDLILNRLASAKHWKIPTDMEQAYLLARAYEDRVDWGYVKEEAAKDTTTDYLQRLSAMLSKRRKGVSGRQSRSRNAPQAARTTL